MVTLLAPGKSPIKLKLALGTTKGETSLWPMWMYIYSESSYMCIYTGMYEYAYIYTYTCDLEFPYDI